MCLLRPVGQSRRDELRWRPAGATTISGAALLVVTRRFNGRPLPGVHLTGRSEVDCAGAEHTAETGAGGHCETRRLYVMLFDEPTRPLRDKMTCLVALI